MLNKEEEAYLAAKYGRTGLGAKVYSVFKTEDGTLGRINKFIDTRTLEPEDVKDAEIRRDIARGLARFHALDVSFKPKVGDGRGFYKVLTQGLKTYQGSKQLKEVGGKTGVNIDELIDYDFATKVREVIRTLNALSARKGWCIHDMQYGNVLVRNQPKLGQSKIVLIDFKFAIRNYRGFDIGGHFMQKIFK